MSRATGAYLSIASVVLASILSGQPSTALETTSCSDVADVVGIADLDQLQALASPTCESDYDSVDLILPDGVVTSIPEPGHGYTASASVVDGAEEFAFSVATSESGEVAVSIDNTIYGEEAVLAAVVPNYDHDAEHDAEPEHDAEEIVKTGSYSTSAKCSSSSTSSFVKSGRSWSGTYKWWYKSNGQPSTSSLDRIKAAASVWDGVVAVCGTTLGNNAVQSYGGTATNYPSVTTSGGCSGGDSGSVVGWGAINDTDNKILALACSYYFGGPTLEADIKFDSGRSWFVSSSTSGCSSKYDLQGVATHEMGHAFGLSHKDGTGQVMQSTAATCGTSQRALGYGDAYGIKSIYG